MGVKQNPMQQCVPLTLRRRRCLLCVAQLEIVMFRTLFALLVGATCITNAQATTLDFEELSYGPVRTTLLESPFITGTFESGDFTFASPEGTVFAYGPDNSNIFIPNAGSVFLNIQRGQSIQASLEMGRTDGALFNVSGLDVAEGRSFRTILPGRPPSAFGSTALDFLGTRLDGSTISFTHTFDGIADHTGPEDDFETISLVGFSNLRSLLITGAGGGYNGYSFSVDNIATSTIAPVPLPASALLLLTALAGLGLRRAVSIRSKA